MGPSPGDRGWTSPLRLSVSGKAAPTVVPAGQPPSVRMVTRCRQRVRRIPRRSLQKLRNAAYPEPSFTRGGAPMTVASAVDRLIRLRAVALALCLVAVAVAWGPSSRLEFDRSVEGLFHKDDPAAGQLSRRQAAIWWRRDRRWSPMPIRSCSPSRGWNASSGSTPAAGNIPGVQGVHQPGTGPACPARRSARSRCASTWSTKRSSRSSCARRCSTVELYRGRLLSTDGEDHAVSGQSGARSARMRRRVPEPSNKCRSRVRNTRPAGRAWPAGPC